MTAFGPSKSPEVITVRTLERLTRLPFEDRISLIHHVARHLIGAGKLRLTK
jgi:hypothetical protein